MNFAKDIPGYEGYYAIDMAGNVFSYRMNRLLAQSVTGRYAAVKLNRVSRYVHQLILITFIGPRPDGAISRHLDGNCFNNDVFNLEWSTQSQNMLDRKWTGAIADKLTVNEVTGIKYLIEKGLSNPEIAGIYGINRKAVYNIRKGIMHRDV